MAEPYIPPSVGCRVRVIKSLDSGDEKLLGQLGNIVDVIEPSSDPPLYLVAADNGYRQWLGEEQFEIIPEENQLA